MPLNYNIDHQNIKKPKVNKNFQGSDKNIKKTLKPQF